MNDVAQLVFTRDDEIPDNQIEFIEINAKLADVYENITEAKELD